MRVDQVKPYKKIFYLKISHFLYLGSFSKRRFSLKHVVRKKKIKNKENKENEEINVLAQIRPDGLDLKLNSIH